jgi:hypothetical protein
VFARLTFLGLSILMVVAGCAEPAPKPSDDFTMYLSSYGQVFTPQEAPADAPHWRPGIPVDFPVPGAKVETAIYGVVTCVDPTKDCATRGVLAGPGETVPIWIVTFVEGVGRNACPAWAVVHGRAGTMMNGTGPPCP